MNPPLKERLIALVEEYDRRIAELEQWKVTGVVQDGQVTVQPCAIQAEIAALAMICADLDRILSRKGE